MKARSGNHLDATPSTCPTGEGNGTLEILVSGRGGFAAFIAGSDLADAKEEERDEVEV